MSVRSLVAAVLQFHLECLFIFEAAVLSAVHDIPANAPFTLCHHSSTAACFKVSGTFCVVKTGLHYMLCYFGGPEET